MHPFSDDDARRNKGYEQGGRVDRALIKRTFSQVGCDDDGVQRRPQQTERSSKRALVREGAGGVQHHQGAAGGEHAMNDAPQHKQQIVEKRPSSLRKFGLFSLAMFDNLY